MITELDIFYMKEALKEAQLAAESDEVPVGAIMVRDGEIVARARNSREGDKNPLSHAEIKIINDTCRALGGWRLTRCTLYVTLEPCPMCAGAILTSRIKEVYFGAYDEKYGCLGSAMSFSFPGGFQTPRIVGGYMTEQCEELLRGFFSGLRK